MGTFVIIGLIMIYSSFTLYKTLRKKFKGECDACTGCSLNGACPVQSIKSKELIVSLNPSNIK